MRFFAPFVALVAAVATAQTASSSNNQISIPDGGLKIAIGSNTITWTNPSSGSVTIKLQQGSNITPTSGVVVASGVPASAGTATFNINQDDVNSFQYVIEIIDESNPSNYNFSNNFSISGATGTATGTASSTGSSSASSTSASMSVTSMSSSSASSTSSSSSSNSRSTSSASRTSSSSASNTSSTSATSAPTTNAGSNLQVQGGLIALVAAVAAF